MPGQCGRCRGISIHAPREGCDLDAAVVAAVALEFQSTHPVRGATQWALTYSTRWIFQSTHPVRGATVRRIRVATSR